MASLPLATARLEEHLVFFSLALSYPAYVLGGLYVLGSVLGWLLLLVWLVRSLCGSAGQWLSSLRHLSPLIWLWLFSMLIMLLALWVAHSERELGLATTVKSTLGWAKGWALLALFPALGVLLNIRPEFICRGVCISAACAIPFALAGMLFYVLGLPGELYISPLKIIGGPSDVFQIRWFGINPETGLPRFQFLGPWAPAAGLLSCLYMVIALRETCGRWRCLGCLGALTMCVLSQSRAGLAIFLAIIPLVYALKRLHRGQAWLLLGLVLPILVLLCEPLYQWAWDAYIDVKQSRPGSTRVRAALARIALERWQHEAPIWGHGIVERGPKLVEFMPIGTHHSWYGLLFVKGLVGFFALALPLTMTGVYLLYRAQTQHHSTALALCCVLIAYSFFENLEILAYVYWPALLWLGMALHPLAPVDSGCTNSGVHYE